MGDLCSGQSWRKETLALDSIALYRRMGMETIPKETTPFHIDRGMNGVYRQSTGLRLLFVSARLSGTDVATVHQHGRARDPRQRDGQHDGQPGDVDAVDQRLVVELERGEVQEPVGPFEQRPELGDEVARDGKSSQQ